MKLKIFQSPAYAAIHAVTDLSANNSVSSFIEVPLDSRLKVLLERECNIYAMVNY